MFARKPAEIHEIFALAFGAHDADQLLNLYADDAVMIPGPGEAPVQGHGPIRQAVASLLAMQPRNITVTTLLCLEADGLALLRSRWQFDAVSPDGETLKLSGSGIEVAQRMPDGRWLQVYDHPWGGDALDTPSAG